MLGEDLVTAIGDRELRPVTGEPVTNRASPRWRVQESRQVLNVSGAIVSHGNPTSPATPVAAFLNASFPASLRAILVANEVAIQHPDASRD